MPVSSRASAPAVVAVTGGTTERRRRRPTASGGARRERTPERVPEEPDGEGDCEEGDHGEGERADRSDGAANSSRMADANSKHRDAEGGPHLPMRDARRGRGMPRANDLTFNGYDGNSSSPARTDGREPFQGGEAAAAAKGEDDDENYPEKSIQMSPCSFVVENDLLRLADFLRKKFKEMFSKGHVKRCLQKEWITVNQMVRTHKSTLLTTGDVVTVNATNFQISQVRFAEPLLQTIHQGTHCKILLKPGGMPRNGQGSVTVEHALPASMDDEHYEVIDLVGRIVSGPVIVSFNNNPTRQALMDVPKRYTFQLIVHGIPPDHLDVAGFVSLQLLRTINSTTGDLSVVQVILTHSGDGLRGCFRRSNFPILGTAARTKSAKNGCFFACTKLELQWKDQAATTVELKVPEKFHAVLEREQRFYDIKKQRETEEERQQIELRSEYVDRMGGTSEDLLSSHWSVASFCGLSFYITGDVMSPKSSSEVLAQTAKEHLPKADASVLDLGTGSGCLLVSTLVDECHTITGVGVDISTDALKIADINIQSHGLSDRILLQQGDFIDLSFLGARTFDVVLCNPPYLTEGECKKDGLLGPRVALVAEHKGLACYEMVARQVGNFLKPNGVMVLEVGGKRKVDEILAIFKDLDHVETRPDDQGRGRCLVLRKPSIARST